MSPMIRAAAFTVVALLLLFIAEWVIPVGGGDDVVPAVAPVTAGTPISPPAPPTPITDNLDKRPLFSEARGADQVAATLPTAPPPESLDLAGIIYSSSGKVALLQSDGSKDLLHVREGDTVERWKIRSIAPDHVTIQSSDGIQDLRFPEPR